MVAASRREDKTFSGEKGVREGIPAYLWAGGEDVRFGRDPKQRRSKTVCLN